MTSSRNVCMCEGSVLPLAREDVGSASSSTKPLLRFVNIVDYVAL